jgi:TonB family protein
MFARLVSLLLPLLLLAGAVHSQTPEEVVHSFAGQKLLLRAITDQRHKLKKKDLSDLQGTCDSAVEVTYADWNRGKVRFKFVEIGTPYLPDRPRGVCKLPGTYDNDPTIEISGFADDEKPDELAASIGQVLQTPQQYVNARGVPFNIPELAPDLAGTEDKTGVRISPPTVMAPKQILGVDPTYSEEARQAKFQGQVKLWFVVGSDGRVRNVKVLRSLGHGLDECAIKVLPLWLFEPARKEGVPVAVQENVEMSFRLY